MNITCLKCGKPMQLLQDKVENYAWQCADKCYPPVDMGVPVAEDISDFERQLTTYAPHNLIILPSADQKRITGAKVYAPHILIHFIECNWGGCYNSIYSNFLIPYFDSISVLDYVLRTSVVEGTTVLENGIPVPKMYGELLSRLKEFWSEKIKKYLAQNFDGGTA